MLFKEAKKDLDKWDEAKKCRNLVNDACKQAKTDFIKKKLIENEGNPRKFWAQLKPLCKDTKSDARGETIENSNPNDVPTIFNTFSCKVGTDLKQKVQELNKEELSKLLLA